MQKLSDDASRWLRWSLAMQVRALRGRVGMADASRRWRARLWLSSFWVGLASLRWFGPRWLRHVGTLAAPLLGGAAVVGAWLGLLAWFLGRHVLFCSDPQYVDWTVVVGWWGSVTCALALVNHERAGEPHAETYATRTSAGLPRRLSTTVHDWQNLLLMEMTRGQRVGACSEAWRLALHPTDSHAEWR